MSTFAICLQLGASTNIIAAEPVACSTALFPEVQINSTAASSAIRSDRSQSTSAGLQSGTAATTATAAACGNDTGNDMVCAAGMREEVRHQSHAMQVATRSSEASSQAAPWGRQAAAASTAATTCRPSFDHAPDDLHSAERPSAAAVAEAHGLQSDAFARYVRKAPLRPPPAAAEAAPVADLLDSLAADEERCSHGKQQDAAQKPLVWYPM